MIDAKLVPSEVVLGKSIKSGKRFSSFKKQQAVAVAVAVAAATTTTMPTDDDNSLCFTIAAVSVDDEQTCMDTMSKYAYSTFGGASSIGGDSDFDREEEYSLFDDGSIYTHYAKQNRNNNLNNCNSTKLHQFSFSSSVQLPGKDYRNENDGDDSFASPIPPKKEVENTTNKMGLSFETDEIAHESKSSISPRRQAATVTKSTASSKTLNSRQIRTRPSLLTANRFASSLRGRTSNPISSSSRRSMWTSMRSFRIHNNATNKKLQKNPTTILWSSFRNLVSPTAAKATACSCPGISQQSNSNQLHRWASFRISRSNHNSKRTPTVQGLPVISAPVVAPTIPEIPAFTNEAWC